MERILGTGFELGVFREGAGLLLGIPVANSHVDRSFDFPISEEDFAVLAADPYRRLSLFLILHEMLQPRVRAPNEGATDTECQDVIERVLHGEIQDISKTIANSRSEVFIRNQLEKAGF